MTERIILSIITIIMFALTLKQGDKRSIFITIGLAIGILVTWIGIPIIMTSGMAIYMITAITMVLTNLNIKTSSKLHQITIILSGIWAFGTMLFSLMHWPYGGLIRLSAVVPVIFYVTSMWYGLIKKREFGYLTILNFQFLCSLL
jgi:hypothetical protein